MHTKPVNLDTEPALFWNHSPDGFKTPSTRLKKKFAVSAVLDPGEGSEGAQSPVVFRPNWGPKGRKIIFLRPTPLISGSGWLGLPNSFIWLRVWIRHCLDLSRIVCAWPYCDSKTHRGLGPRDLKGIDRAEYLGVGTRQMFHHTSVLTTSPPLFPITPGHIYVEQKNAHLSTQPGECHKSKWNLDKPTCRT